MLGDQCHNTKLMREMQPGDDQTSIMRGRQLVEVAEFAAPTLQA